MTTIIDLPHSGYVEASPRFVDFSTRHIPNLGQEEQQIVRMGARYAVAITLGRKLYEAVGDEGGMEWISLLEQAMQGEARYPFPQPKIATTGAGTPRVRTAGQSGSILSSDGFSANYAYRRGQAFSLIHGGNHYLHKFSANGSVDANGIGSLPIFPMLRVEPDDNALLEIETPLIQGKIAGDQTSWTIDRMRTTGITFAIVEKR